MAEGGNQSSIQDGSDADIAFTCTPCSELETTAEAVKYCPECDEYLCTTCTKYHLKMRATRDHALAEREEMKHESHVVKKTKVKTKCPQHPDREIEMFCSTHDMVYCLMCIATDHRPCSDVISVSDAAGSHFQQDEIESLQEESESVKEFLVALENRKQENIVFVEEERNNIRTRVKEIEDGMIHQIKTFSEQANVNLDDTYLKVKDALESEINMLSRSRAELENTKKQLQSATEINREHQFVQVKLCQKTINDSKLVNAKFESHGDITIEFAESTNLTRQLLEVKSFGIIKEARVNRKREIKCQKEIIVKKQNDQNKCRIMDVLQLDSRTCILVDTANKKLKLLDTNHNVTLQFNVDGIPTGVCRTGYNEVAVKFTCCRIDILSVGIVISKLRSFYIQKGGEYWGIVYTAGNFWVSTGTDIDMYDTSGTLVKSISKDEIGQKIFKSTIRQMTVYQNSVFVADSSDGIVCLERDGSKKTEFRDSKLTRVRTVGVCVSSDGTVYAVDEQSKKIIMFNQDGKCLGEMAPEVSGEKTAESLCYDEKNDCIRIGYSSSDTITVLFLNE